MAKSMCAPDTKKAASLAGGGFPILRERMAARRAWLRPRRRKNSGRSGRRRQGNISLFRSVLGNDTFDPQRPFQPIDRFAPEPPIAPLQAGRPGWGRCRAHPRYAGYGHAPDRYDGGDRVGRGTLPRRRDRRAGRCAEPLPPLASRRAIRAPMVQNQACSALRNGSARTPRGRYW